MKTEVIKLSAYLDLLAKARVRKIGYEKMNTSAIWFSTYKQEHQIYIIDRAILRLENKCATICNNILMNVY